LVQNRNAPLEKLQLAISGREFDHLFRTAVDAILKHFGISPKTPFMEYPAVVINALRDGLDERIEFRYGDCTYESKFQGLNAWFRKRIDATSSQKRRQYLVSYMAETDCPACEGSRLRPESRAVKINDLSIADYCRAPLSECRAALEGIRMSDRERQVAEPIVEEILHRLSFLIDLGLEYLTLDRKAHTLSAGEAQRIRLATQVGSQLRGVLYVLDEPSIGLHARDTKSLLRTLAKMRDLGNTIIIVEHDEETIRSADHLVDLGPRAGVHGGKIVAEGDLAAVTDSKESLTAAYLRGERSVVPRNGRFRPETGNLELVGVCHNNLKELDVSFPLGRLIAVTGVSGAGKSSLVDEVLYRALSRHLYGSLLDPGSYTEIRGMDLVDKVIEIDQTPIGKTPRSNPATYTGVFTPIRELFALLPESRIRGYKPGRFSFNVKGGRCETCRGEGMRRIEMNFLPDVFVLCDACQGSRYNRETLAVKYKGCTIADILEMSVEKAFTILENIPPIKKKLLTLLDVGLGYISLGQSSTTLSGGEAQRVKLARELSRKSTGNTLYILDEPTTGLHFEDVKHLLEILYELVNLGNTVIVIEHNLDIVRCADWIIDLGPEGGDQGGRVVATGTPEQVAAVKESHTGQALARFKLATASHSR
jgi:excinuclease ABC subunit A